MNKTPPLVQVEKAGDLTSLYHIMHTDKEDLRSLPLLIPTRPMFIALRDAVSTRDEHLHRVSPIPAIRFDITMWRVAFKRPILYKRQSNAE